MWKKVRVFALVCASLAVALAAGEVAAKKHKGKRRGKGPTVVASDALKWVESKEMKGVSMAVLRGNPKRGRSSAMVKWAGGTEMPLHWHSATAEGVCVSGTMVVTDAKGTVFECPPGTYFSVPGRFRHTSACKAGADCVYYVRMSGRFDQRMVKAKKKKEAPKAEEKKEEAKPEEAKPEEKKAE